MSNKIIVIGAGASGLMAASALAKKNHQVTVVEARDRIGGRIYTASRDFTLPIEMGAEFMHGKQPLTHALIKKCKSEIDLLSGNWYELRNGLLQRGDFFDEQWDMLTKALKKLKTDIDIATFLNEHFGDSEFADLREKVKGFVEGYDAADMHRVSALALREEWEESDDNQHYHIQGGYSKLMNHLEQLLNTHGGAVLLSSPATEIHWTEGKVKLITGTGKILEAEKIIVTIPLGVLQKGTVKFTPALPGHTKAFTEMGFGGVIKFFFEFKNPFWEDSISRPLKKPAFVFSDAEIPTWWSQLPNKTPMLTGWLGGPSTHKISHERDALYEKAIRSLSYIFGCNPSEVENEIRFRDLADWVEDPYAFGAYAYPTVKTKQARKFLSESVKKTIYFAGEAVYDGSAIGTVEAALMSGKEVASHFKG